MRKNAKKVFFQQLLIFFGPGGGVFSPLTSQRVRYLFFIPILKWLRVSFAPIDSFWANGFLKKKSPSARKI